MCICAPGYCAIAGECQPSPTCTDVAERDCEPGHLTPSRILSEDHCCTLLDDARKQRPSHFAQCMATLNGEAEREFASGPALTLLDLGGSTQVWLGVRGGPASLDVELVRETHPPALGTPFRTLNELVQPALGTVDHPLHVVIVAGTSVVPLQGGVPVLFRVSSGILLEGLPAGSAVRCSGHYMPRSLLDFHCADGGPAYHCSGGASLYVVFPSSSAAIVVSPGYGPIAADEENSMQLVVRVFIACIVPFMIAGYWIAFKEDRRISRVFSGKGYSQSQDDEWVLADVPERGGVGRGSRIPTVTKEDEEDAGETDALLALRPAMDDGSYISDEEDPEKASPLLSGRGALLGR